MCLSAACLILTLALSTGAVAEGRLAPLWQGGDFDAVAEALSQLGNGPQEAATLADAARAAEESSDFALAADYYGRLAAALSERQTDLYREARRREWLCASQADISGWDRDAAAHITQLLNTPTVGSPRQLGLELEAILAEVQSGELKPGQELRSKFPHSEVTLRAAKLRLNAAAAMRDDRQRLAAAKQALADFPGCYWEHMAYRLWLYSAVRLGDAAELKAAGTAYLAARPDSALAQGTVSRYYLEMGIEGAAGYEAAKRSVEFYAKALGVTTDSDLARVNSSTMELAGIRRRDWVAPDRREQFIEYLGSRFNLARYELSRGQRKAALAQAEPVIALRPFRAGEEQSLAAFYLVAGQAKESLGDWPAAYRYFTGALVEPDPQGRYGLQAEPALRRVSQYLSDKEKQNELARFLPVNASLLPSFSDITEPAGLKGVGALRASWIDADGDQDPDLLLDGSRLFINDARKGFTDAGREWGLGQGSSGRSRFSGGLGEEESRAKSVGAAVADFDNDGDQDFYAFGNGPGADILWRNEGGRRFVDVTPASGAPADEAQTDAACWLDFDSDGWLDLAVAGFGQRIGQGLRGPRSAAEQRLYRNSGRETFVQVNAAQAGLTRREGAAASSSLSSVDANGDGYADLFSAGRFGAENALWLGGPDGQFIESARGAGISGLAEPLLLAGSPDSSAVYARSIAGDTWGSAWGDLNNDGILDLVSPKRGLPGEQGQFFPPQLFLLSNPGSPARERARELGIKADVNYSSALCADFNNDGNLDIFFSCAGEGRRSALFLNGGNGSFSDVSYLSAARAYNTFGSACADFDLDGDVDLLACAANGVRLLRNDSKPLGWVSVVCQGSGTEGGSNRSGIGARITVTCGPVSCTREVQSSSGLGCGNDLTQHFGLGTYGGLVGIKVRFPSGKELSKSLAVSPGMRVLADEEGGITELPPVAQTSSQTPKPPKPETIRPAPERPETPSRPSGPSRGGR
ncbi:CRTAC1 family protein [bacterium]|nr:CRTAC1 family protein [bacterium]